MTDHRQPAPPAGSTAPRRIALVLLLALYLVTGLFGRFPWKADEPYTFGAARDALVAGHWLVPHVAGDPFIEKPPLVYWLGAVGARVFDMVPMHEGSRVAVLLLVAVTGLGVFWSAQWLHPEATRWRRWVGAGGDAPAGPLEQGLLALLLLAGTLGLAEQLHKLTTDLGQLAGCTVAVAGLVRLGTLADPRAGAAAVRCGLAIGTGVGVAFLSKGLLGPGLVGLGWLASLAVPQYRSRAAALAAMIAFMAALPWLLIWPLRLRAASPELFDEWFWTNNVGRFVGSAQLGGNSASLTDKLLTLAAAVLPGGWLVAVAALRSGRRALAARQVPGLATAPGHVFVAAYVAIAIAVLLGSRSFRANYLLPLLPAVVLLALPALTLASGPVMRWLGKLATAGLVAAVVAFIAIAAQLALTGVVGPAQLADAVARVLPQPFPLHIGPLALAAAAAALLLGAWLWSALRSAGAGARWSIGVCVLWTVVFALLMPWVDASRSYRSVFGELRTQLWQTRCLVAAKLGESELALLEYVVPVDAVRPFLNRLGTPDDPTRPNPAAAGCDALLTLEKGRAGSEATVRPGWAAVWQGHRPGDARERFTLYRRVNAGAALPTE